jgi:hypothetical protein
MANTAAPETHLDRLSALLRQAETTTNEHEREAFMAAAQRLATLGAIDLEVARQHVPAAQRKEHPTVETISIGAAGSKGLATFCRLFMAIGRTNDLKFNVAHNSSYVVAFGFPSDIEATRTLYASIVVQMVQASNAYIASGEYKFERNWNTGRPVHGSTARISFQNSYAERIGARLRDARQAAVAERKAADDAVNAAAAVAPTAELSAPGVGLVLAKKTEEVDTFYAKTSRARGSWKGGSSNQSASAYRAGSSAADGARLSAPRALSGARGSLR